MSKNESQISLDNKKQDRLIIKNGLASVFFKGLSFLISFLSAPLLLSCLGEVKYGIYVTSLSLISWIYYFDFGIGSGLRNQVTKAIVNEDYDTAQKSVSVAYYIISLISLAFSSAVFIASFFVDFDKLLNAGLNDENLNTIILVSVVFACLNFVLSLSKNLLWAMQKPALVDGIGIVSQFVWLVALFGYSRTRQSSMLVIVVLEGVSALIRNILAQAYVGKHYPQIMPTLNRIDMSYSKGILGFGIQIFIMQISALVLNATDNIIVMKLFSASDVTPYSIGHKYFLIINAFFTAATSALWTTYTTAYAMKDVNYIRKTLKKALLFYLVALVGIIIAYFIFVPFMRLYLGRDLYYQPGLVFLIAIYYAILIFSHIFSAFVHGISKVKLTTIACVISAVVNVPCSIILATTFGMRINGVIMGSIISLLITTPCYIYTTFKEINKI